MAWHHLSMVHFPVTVRSSFWVLSKAKCTAQCCRWPKTVGLILILHLLDTKSVHQTRFQFSSQFTVITAPPSHPAVMVTELWKNKLRNMRHGRWQTHGHIVTETDGVSAEWFDTTDSNFPIQTSSMQVIKKDSRQKLCGTQQSQEKKPTRIWVSAWHSRAEWMEVIARNRFYCSEVHLWIWESWSVILPAAADTGLVPCTKEINESTYWHELFRF